VAFYEVRFPPEISHGSVMGPGHNTAIVEVDAGSEERVARWTGGRYFADAANGVKTRVQMGQVLEFARSMRGALHGFRWKDWSDFATDASHQALVTLTATDELIQVGDNQNKVFQLKKVYSTAPAPSITRLIEKPVQGTILIAVNGVTKTEGTDYTVSYATGQVTFNVAPPASQNVTWGGQFDVPVRFGKELDQLLSIRFDAHDVRANDSIPIVEVINEKAIDDEFPYRGGVYISPFDADITLAPSDPFAIAVNPTLTTRVINLPDPTVLPAGGIWFVIQNLHATNPVTVQDNTALTVAVIAGYQTLTLVILPDSSGTNKWVGY